MKRFSDLCNISISILLGFGCWAVQIKGALADTATLSDCLLIAGYENERPFHFKNDYGRVVGSDADTLSLALQSLGCKVTFNELPWSRTLMYAEEGRINIAMGASFKDKRANWGYYSIPYKSIRHWLYTRKDMYKNINPRTIDSIDAFFDKKLVLGVVLGWGYPVEIRNAINDPANSKFVNKVAKFYQLPKILAIGRVDGIIAIPEQLEVEVKHNKLTRSFIPRAQYKEELHFIFSKKSVSPEIVANFNNALYRLINSGKRKTIFMNYQ